MRGARERLLEMISDLDITVRATADGRDPACTTVEEVMASDVPPVVRDLEARDAADCWVHEAAGLRRVRRPRTAGPDASAD